MRTMSRCRRSCRVLAVALWACAGAATAQSALPERDLKAQIVVRSLLFVEWPAAVLAPGQPIVLCVTDAHPRADALDRLAGQPVNGHRLEVRRTTPSALAPCQVVVLGLQALSALKSPPRGLLLVSDAQGASDLGAMINLQTDQERVVFDVNLSAVRSSGLDISTRLLRLARFVRRD
jgi:hypothetical protein